MAKITVPLILILGALIFGRALNFSFVSWDDPAYFADNRQVVEPGIGPWVDIWTPTLALNGEKPEYMPVTESAYRLVAQLFGVSARAFHLLASAAFLAACVAALLLLESLTDSGTAAFWGTLFFLVHPFHVESAAWTSGTKDSLSAIFLFLGLRAIVGKRPGHQELSLLWLLLALGSKGTAMVFVPLALLCTWWTEGRVGWKDIRRLIPHGLVTLLFVFIYWQAGEANQTIKSYLDDEPAATFFTMVQVFGNYLLKVILPTGLSAHYKPIPVQSFTETGVWLSAVAMGILMSAAFWLRKQGRELLFALIWFLLALIPVSNLVPISLQMADRYMFVALLGFSLLFGQIVERAGARHRYARIVACVVLSVFAALSVMRTAVWRDSVSLWSDAAHKAPLDTIAWNNYGSALSDMGRYSESERVFDHVTRMAPWKAAGWNNLGHSQLQLFRADTQVRRLTDAETNLRRAIQLKAHYAVAENNLGLVLWARGLLERRIEILYGALEAFMASGRSDPKYVVAIRNADALRKQLGEIAARGW